MRFALENARILSDYGVVAGGTVLIDGDTIAAVAVPGGQVEDCDCRLSLDGHRLIPGFVDIQVNGGGGMLFNNSPDLATIKGISDAHVRFGTTSLLPTLISDDEAVMRDAIAAIRQAIGASVPGILGIHLEGPFLSPEKSGAHDRSKFQTIDDDAVELLSMLSKEAVTLVTLAPERTTDSRIRELTENGVIVFAGHTAATYEECVAAERAGLTGYTHLFNAMTPFSSREPGAVGAALDSKSAVFGIIADGHHVHPASVRHACTTKWRGGALLVTDAMPTVGSQDNFFVLNGERIELADGVLRNATGSLAGSSLTMIDAVKNVIKFAGIDWDEAVRMASTYPARALGRNSQVGSIRAGCKADLVELTDDFEIARVWRRGELAFVNDGLGVNVA